MSYIGENHRAAGSGAGAGEKATEWWGNGASAAQIPSNPGRGRIRTWGQGTHWRVCLFFFVVLGFELRAYTLSHSTNPSFVFLRWGS
jgi:hypothetical protein